jgi:hypothetical protein
MCRKWLSTSYGRAGWAYGLVPPRILVEEILCSRDNKELKDYRLYTFHGVVKAINVGAPSFRMKSENIFLDPSWNEFILSRYKERLPDPIPPKPATLGEMLEAAERLGRALDFVRIDLYDTTRGIVLGEMTLYPEGGQRNTPTACKVFNRWLCDQWIMEGEPYLLRRVFFPSHPPAVRSPRSAVEAAPAAVAAPLARGNGSLYT